MSEAAADLTATLDADPSNGAAYYYRGRAYLGLDRFSEAAADLTATLDADPSNSAAYYYRGRSYLRLERLTEAVSDLTAALRAGEVGAEGKRVLGDLPGGNVSLAGFMTHMEGLEGS